MIPICHWSTRVVISKEGHGKLTFLFWHCHCPFSVPYFIFNMNPPKKIFIVYYIKKKFVFNTRGRCDWGGCLRRAVDQRLLMIFPGSQKGNNVRIMDGYLCVRYGYVNAREGFSGIYGRVKCIQVPRFSAFSFSFFLTPLD